MCGISCVTFLAKTLRERHVKGKRVLEVGSYDHTGSVRPIVESMSPKKYVGVDMEKGPSVDIICMAEELVKRFGKNSFDLVITTEMLEHVKDWRVVISNLKQVCKPEGLIVITTRSKGFPYHSSPYINPFREVSNPYDNWRFEVDDMKNIFSDFKILRLEKDPSAPGVFICARKPKSFVEKSRPNKKLYNIVVNRKVIRISKKDMRSFYFWFLVFKTKFKEGMILFARRLFYGKKL